MEQKLNRAITYSTLGSTLLLLAACSNAASGTESADKGKAGDTAALASGEATKAAACQITGFSIDQDPNGLNVRANPDIKAAVLGKLLPVGDPESHHDHDGEGKKSDIPEQSYFGPRFTIIAVNGDWLKIDSIEAKTEGINPKNGNEWSRDNFQGSGWVHYSKVQPSFGGGEVGNPSGHAYKGPSFESGKILHAADTNMRGIDTIWTDVPKILECNGRWAKIEFTQYGESDPKTNLWTSYPKAKRKKVIGWMTGA
jgi:hypothetical protein